MAEQIIVEDLNDDVLQEWSAENPDLIYSVKSNSNKPLSISKPISAFGMTTNQANSLSISPNNVNAGRSGEKKAVIIDSALRNKKAGESNRDAKIGLEI